MCYGRGMTMRSVFDGVNMLVTGAVMYYWGYRHGLAKARGMLAERVAKRIAKETSL